MRPVRVLIVDDSATIRRILAAILSADPGIEVVGAAPEPAVARQMIKDLNPDVLTLDVEMPNMNGLEFLEKIMRLRPMPVVMVSTLTKRGAEITLAALELGAVDYFAKPTENVAAVLQGGAQELAEKVKAAASARVRPRSASVTSAANKVDAHFEPGDRIVAIGSSTGGVEALIEVLSHFPRNCPPTVITQHMPAHFTTTFAQRLSRLCQPDVTEARDGDVLIPGHVYVAPGGATHLEVTGLKTFRCRLTAADLVSGHRPSVDVLFKSVAATVGGQNRPGICRDRLLCRAGSPIQVSWATRWGRTKEHGLVRGDRGRLRTQSFAERNRLFHQAGKDQPGVVKMTGAKVVAVQNPLRRVLYGPRQVSRNAALEQAQHNVDQLRDEFTQGLANEIGKIEALTHTATGKITDEGLKDGIILSAVIFNLAGTLGYSCLQGVAASLYDLLVVMEEKGLRCIDPLVVHARAARISAPGMPTISEAAAGELMKHLKDVIAHFRNQPDPCAKSKCGNCPVKQHGM